jgi:predicted kinase
VIFVGLPASGKTTFYGRRFAATHRHVSKDLWPNAPNREARQARELREAFGAGASVVVDNTSPSPADRAPIIAIAREHGARVIGYYFTAGMREALGRNRRRKGRARVPDVAILTRARAMVTPSRDEGFDELYRVGIGDDGQFRVEAA